MLEGKSKRDLIWEEKKRQREERLLSNQFINEGLQGNIYQDEAPISIPSQQNFEQPSQYPQSRQFDLPQQRNIALSEHQAPVIQQDQFMGNFNQPKNQNYPQQQQSFQPPPSQNKQRLRGFEDYNPPVPQQQIYEKKLEPPIMNYNAPIQGQKNVEQQVSYGQNAEYNRPNINNPSSKQVQKQEMMRALQEQMEEKKRKKEFEKQQERLEYQKQEELRNFKQRQILEEQKLREEQIYQQKQNEQRDQRQILDQRNPYQPQQIPINQYQPQQIINQFQPQQMQNNYQDISYNGPDSYQQNQYDEPLARQGRNRLNMENINLADVQQKQRQKQEMQRALQEQMEQNKRKKELEKQQKIMEGRNMNQLPLQPQQQFQYEQPKIYNNASNNQFYSNEQPFIENPRNQFQQPSNNQDFQYIPEQQNNVIYQQQPIQQQMLTEPEGQIRMGRNRLGMENANLDDVQKKQQQKLEMQRALQEQIEEKKRKKEFEKQQREMEDKLEELRVQKEKQMLEEELKREEQQKKQKQGNVIQENVDLKEQRRLQRLQERKQNKQPQVEQQDAISLYMQQPPPQQYDQQPPPSQPKSDHYLREFMIQERLKEGINPEQSIMDFYKNGPREVQQNKEVEELKKQIQQNQEQVQQQMQQFIQQAQVAMQQKQKVENELYQLKDQVKNKYIQEEQHHQNLMVALVKSDPKWEKQIFPPHLLAQAQIGEYRDLAMPEIKQMELPTQQVGYAQQPAYASKPIILKDEPPAKKQEFREQFGLQSLVSDSNMVPIDGNASIVPLQKQQLPQIDELLQHSEDTQKFKPQLDNYQKRHDWNVPSINSDITKEIDELLNYKPRRPPSNYSMADEARQPSRYNQSRPTNQRPPSQTLNRAAQGILGQATNLDSLDNRQYKGITLDSDFPDLTMVHNPPKQQNSLKDTFDIGNINKRMDEKLLRLNELGGDEELDKLDRLLLNYNC